jgi:FkbM family methyltransferase
MGTENTENKELDKLTNKLETCSIHSLTSANDIKDINTYIYYINDENNTDKYIFNWELTNDEIKSIENIYIDSDKYIKYLKDKNFIEVGTNFGLHSIKFSRNARTIYSFEPDRLLFNQLCANIFINKIENILPFNYGIAQYEGKTTMSRFLKSDEVGNDQVVDIEPIFLQTLDSFKIKNLGLIKINCNEFQTLLSAEQTIRSNNFPFIMINKDSDEKESVIKYLENLGYKYTIDENFVLFIKTD